MAFPIPSGTEIFSNDQKIAFKAHYWDTTATPVRIGPGHDEADQLTAFGTGLGFAMFDLYPSIFAPVDRGEIEAALIRNVSAPVTSCVLGYDNTNQYRNGVTPVLYSYWGAGSPPGGSRAQQVLLKYSGYVRTAGAVTLVFAGQGTVAAYVTSAATGDVTPLLPPCTLKEPDPTLDASIVSASIIRNEWGYQYTTRTFAVGDKIEVYYWHNGEPWGGIACKVVPGTLAADHNFLQAVREAPVLGTSFMAKEASAIPDAVIPYLVKAEIHATAGEVSELQMDVSLTTAGEEEGFRLDVVAEENSLRDLQSSLVLRKGRLVHFEGGYRTYEGGEELYPRFTGVIDDIFPSSDGQTATIHCRGIESRLTDVFDENSPDRLDYHANGYILRERSAEPVFGIPAFDNWPLEIAIATLATKAGIDSFTMGYPIVTESVNYGRFRYKETESQADYFGSRTFAARSLARPDKMVRLARQSNYGNVPPLQKDYLLPDDEYILKPEVTQRLYDRAKSITDQYGYDFFGNAEGQLVLAGRNNAVYFQYLTQNGLYASGITEGQNQSVQVNAVGGIAFALKDSDGAWSRVVEGRFSRLDLYTGIGVHSDDLNGGGVNVLVEVKNGASWTTAYNTNIDTYADMPQAYYYDDIVRTDGTSACVFRLFSLPFDYYRVTLTPAGPREGQSDCWYRLNGVAIYERDPEQSYYTQGGTPVALSTLANAIKVDAVSNYKDLRNHVVVVGSRKATITDSAKVNSSPNNQEYEFNVAVAADPGSMYDPESPNFVGTKRMTVVFDDKVSDSEFARWIARTILTRYRQPKITAKLNHTALPALEVRDAIYVVEEQHHSVDSLLWVTGYTESWDMDEAMTSIEVSGYPEIPSYQPREDIDVDTLFVDPRDGVGEPVVNVQLSYKNLLGQAVTEADLSDATWIKNFTSRPKGSNAPAFSEMLLNATTITLAKPAIPETFYLSMNVSHADNDAPVSASGIQRGGYRLNRKRVLVNNPYRHFFTLPSWTVSHAPKVDFTFHEGDGTRNIYDREYYNFPSGDPTNDTPADDDLPSDQWYICYDYLLDRAKDGTPKKNPFYDPYTSEVGNFVSVSFDLLVSGRVRVSLWDANQGAGYEIPVAWLTEPTAEAEEPEQHWTYMEAGDGRSFSWDGVDNIGFWNTLQSGDWAEYMKGSFGAKPVAVGAGFYAWNDKSTDRHTLIGDTDASNFDVTNAPYFTIGQFGQFYVKIEVLNDDLVRADIKNTGIAEPRTVNSNSLPNAGDWNTVEETYVWTHLGEPTQVAMRIQDWVGTGAWTSSRVTTDPDWSDYSTPNADASFAEGAPVRFTFVPRARRGKLWERSDGSRVLDEGKIGVKLTRQAQLKATIFDQHWQLTGKSWQDLHSSYSVGGAEQKRLANRMFHNEDHALEWEDGAWRTGENLRSFEWVFDPTMFKKDWGTGQKESLRYGDYEQLESLPGYDGKSLGGTSMGARSYMMLAYINYLFYLSAFSIDRSGRRQWCLNSWSDDVGDKHGFIDKSKIVSSTWRAATPSTAPYAVIDYESRGAETYLVRSIFARQWKEDYWTSATDTRSLVNRYGITNEHQVSLIQPLVADFNPRRKAFMDQTNAARDWWLREYSIDGSRVNRIMHRKSDIQSSNARTLDLDAGVLLYEQTFYMAPTSFGSWDWNRPTVSGFFTPNPCRDFHPYWKYPFMPDAGVRFLYYYTRDRETNALDVLSAAASGSAFRVRDPAARDMWYGFAYADSYATNYAALHSSDAEEEKNYYWGARLERTVEEEGAEEGNFRTGEIAYLYDYSKEDNLDRFDQFRGVLSRAPYADRTKPSGISYTGGNKERAASVQPVKPSGLFLLNLGRYDYYTLAQVQNDNTLADLLVHFVDTVEDWSDIRFRHEYVWYSDRYFPVTQYGGPVYGFTKNEYTKAMEWVGVPWWASRDIGQIPPGVRIAKLASAQFGEYNLTKLYFDPGAWTGWKDDVWAFQNVPSYAEASQWQSWAAAPYLRWQEIGTMTRRTLTEGLIDNAQGGFSPGYSTVPANQADRATVNVTWLHADSSDPKSRTSRQNIFDEHYAQMRRPRLAVGPELPESIGLIMNLALPERLRE